MSKAVPADEPGFSDGPGSFGVNKAPGFAARFFEENEILCLEVIDNRLPVSVHPSGDGNEEELEHSYCPEFDGIVFAQIILNANERAHL